MYKRILVTVIALLLVLAIGMSSAAATMWIKTGNGKPANGRTGPGKDYDFAGYFYYGQAVEPDGQSVNGYTYLIDGAWVMTKFLVNHDPGEYVPNSNWGTNEQSGGSSGSSSGKSSGGSSGSSSALSAASAEFKAARYVTPYEVTTYHKRSSGQINMRWAPAKNAPLLHSYAPGEKLVVIAELKDWRQVQDPETGWVGFIRGDFLQR
jgi:uncharacterized protein YgiM (DUF1202 family)